MNTAERFDAVRPVADAVLYEGYLLYPYRRSSGKNRVRWQFGVLAPRPWLPAAVVDDDSVAGSADAWRQQTECLVEASDQGAVTVCVRFLHLQHRAVHKRTAHGCEPVDELTVAGIRHLTFDEAVPREFELSARLSDLLKGPLTKQITAPGGEETEQLGGAGRIVRTRWPVRAEVRLSAEPVDAPFPLLKLRLEVENAADGPGGGVPRAEVLRVSLLATHSLLAVAGGRFLSLLDPPAWAATAAAGCRNVHCFPVLAGAPGRALLFASPILMDDHPRISPESPGDLFDAAEIDEILSLRTLTLTEEEKREARATDPRAARIIDRVDALPPAVLGGLHGTIRSRRPVSADEAGGADETALAPPPGGAGERPWWEPGADDAIQPEADSVLVGGVPVAKGSRVRLNPRRHGTDVHDMFLAGRAARVEAVLTDVDGSRYVAVSVEDDPGADLHSWYGRHYHFTPEELTVLDGGRQAAP